MPNPARKLIFAIELVKGETSTILHDFLRTAPAGGRLNYQGWLLYGFAGIISILRIPISSYEKDCGLCFISFLTYLFIYPTNPRSRSYSNALRPPASSNMSEKRVWCNLTLLHASYRCLKRSISCTIAGLSKRAWTNTSRASTLGVQICITTGLELVTNMSSHDKDTTNILHPTMER